MGKNLKRTILLFCLLSILSTLYGQKKNYNSHLINLDYVKKYYRHDGGYIEMIDGSTIGISRNKKDLFLIQMARFTK